MKLNNVTIIIIEDSMSRKNENVFQGQCVEFYHQDDISLMGIDGFSSYAAQPLKIFWLNGRCDEFKGATAVIIKAESGELLIERQLNWNQPARHEDGGVIFQVF